MRKRLCILTLLFALLLLVWVVPASAETADNPVIELAPITDHISETDLQGGAALLSLQQWQDGWDSYGDQLDPETMEGSFYKQIEEAAAAAKNNNTLLRSVQLDTIPFTEEEYNYYFTKPSEYENMPMALVLAKAGYAFSYDHPEMFWIRTDIKMSADGEIRDGIYNTDITLIFTSQPSSDTEYEVSALQSKLDAQCATILASVAEMHDYDKLVYFNKWLTEHNEYNTPASKAPSVLSYGDETPWSIVGSLLDGYSPVCEGYAKAFQLLCLKSDIPCITVSGYASGDHMWNAVKLDGSWYFCDPTWEDDGNTLDGRYFLTTNPNSHFPEELFITPAIADEKYEPPTEISFDKEDGFKGYETSTTQVKMFIALFDEHRRMIACGVCEEKTVTTGDSQTVYTYCPPEFDAEDVQSAHNIVRFVLSTDNTPTEDAKDIL